MFDQAAKLKNRQNLDHYCRQNECKGEQHVWFKKELTLGKVSLNVAKLITSPPLHHAEECEAQSFLHVAQSA
jgi:hypothetical protein